jgi:hypothetical protein
LRNYAPEIAAMDFFVVSTIGFDLLYAFVIVRIDLRDLVWINVTKNPTAEWAARQITEAFPWDGAPGYMIRDRDRIYGGIVARRLHAMGIRDKPTAPASPWETGFAERLIGSIRRECMDHIVVFGEAHLQSSVPRADMKQPNATPNVLAAAFGRAVMLNPGSIGPVFARAEIPQTARATQTRIHKDPRCAIFIRSPRTRLPSLRCFAS